MMLAEQPTLCGIVVPHLPHIISGTKPSHFLTDSTTALGITGGPGRIHLHQPTLQLSLQHNSLAQQIGQPDILPGFSLN